MGCRCISLNHCSNLQGSDLSDLGWKRSILIHFCDHIQVSLIQQNGTAGSIVQSICQFSQACIFAGLYISSQFIIHLFQSCICVSTVQLSQNTKGITGCIGQLLGFIILLYIHIDLCILLIYSGNTIQRRYCLVYIQTGQTQHYCNQKSQHYTDTKRHRLSYFSHQKIYDHQKQKKPGSYYADIFHGNKLRIKEQHQKSALNNK